MYLIYSISPFKKELNNRAHFLMTFIKYFLFLAGMIFVPLGFRLFSIEPFEHVFVGYHETLLVAVSCAFLATGFVIPYFWCRYFCFLGAFWGILSQFSFLKYTVSCRGKSCAACITRCPTGAIRDDGKIVQRECIRCNLCQVCTVRTRDDGRKDE